MATSARAKLAAPAPTAEPIEQARSSAMKMFDILDLFTIEEPVVSGQDVAERLGLTRPTAYRYLKTLCDVGLLLGLGRNDFCLGPRIVQLERLIDLTDPLVASGKAVMPSSLERTEWDAFLLCSLCRTTVICVHQETRANSQVRITRARGMPFPLFRGPASLTILANLKPHQAKSLYGRHATEIANAGLGKDWPAFRDKLRTIRSSGYALSINSFGTGLLGIAAPVHDAGGAVIGSVAGVARQEAYLPEKEADLAAGIVDCAARISLRIAAVAPDGTRAIARQTSRA
jgi:DNA-binding IclR family transcriptional regulator